MQMQEKTMVSDILAGMNGELEHYAQMIPQTDNKELKPVQRRWIRLRTMIMKRCFTVMECEPF